MTLAHACWPVVLLLSLLGQPAVGQRPETGLEPALVRATVESLGALVEREYFNPEVAKRVAAGLRERQALGGYAQARTRQELAELLSRDLFAFTNDKHLAVQVVEPRPPSVPLAPDDRREARARRANYGVQRVEVLAGNIGYLNLTFFYRPDEARETLAAAMRVLQSADALILDMRENSGGSPDTAALVLSYVFADGGLPLFEIVPREGRSQHYTTVSAGIVGRDGKRPVYVLTSAETFSAGEGVAFILQERKRAEIIGERTSGAANPGRAYPVNEVFEVTIPNGQVRTAVSGRNWEGSGVMPDVAVTASEALATAHARASARLKESR